MSTTNCQTTDESMGELYSKRDDTGDITFVVGSGRIKAHRCVLAAISSKYRTQFFGLRPDRGEIRIPNVSAGAFNVFLEFFYKGKINLSIENVEEVLDLAKQSLVDKFVDTCVRFLESKMTSQNVCWVYGLAVKYDLGSLRFSCERQIQRNPKQVFASDGFLHCNHEILLDILKMNSLACTETDVFNACIAWARANCKQKRLDDGNQKNLRAVLGDAIYQIRFASMDAKESAALHKSMPGFFTSDETVELFYIVGKVDGFKSKKFNQKPRSVVMQFKTPSSTSMKRSLDSGEAATSRVKKIRCPLAKLFDDCEDYSDLDSV